MYTQCDFKFNKLSKLAMTSFICWSLGLARVTVLVTVKMSPIVVCTYSM